MSLKGKVVLLFAAPTFFAVVLTSVRLTDSWRAKRDASEALGILAEVRGLSVTVHELQRERGSNVKYLSGSDPLEKLEEQRARTNRALAELEKVSGFARDLRRELPELRSAVDQKNVTKKDAIASFTKLVERLLAEERAAVPRIRVIGLPAKVRSVVILESAKEMAGRLRASVVDAVADDAPLTPQRLDRVLSFAHGVESQLQSQGLTLSTEAEKQIASFLRTPEWEHVRGTLDRLISRAGQGGYGEEPGKFYEVVTRAIDSLVPVVQQQVADAEKDAQGVHVEKTRELAVFGLFAFASVALILSVGVTVTRRLITQLIQVSESLLESNQFIDKESKNLSQLSSQLVSSASKEASSLERTATAAEEISSMVKRTSDTSSNSRSAVDQCVQIAAKGQQIVGSMAQVSDQMAGMNAQILTDISSNNQQLEKIITLFAKIQDKTRVINDIVFQTKLLSFNASVEAARAGEHGKGFSVVAEEVGRLAVMSGSSASEISALLQSVSREIEAIVATAKENTARISASVQGKTGEMVTNVKACNESFQEISDAVGRIAAMIHEISTAASEQAAGVGEINRAIGEAERLSSANSGSASAVNVGATSLRSQMSYLKTSIRTLTALLSGVGAGAGGQVSGADDQSGDVGEFVWGPQFCIGVGEMDREHEILVGKINALVRTMNHSKDKAVVLKSFGEMAAYVVEHFRDEEVLMQEIGYKEYEGHRKVHERLVKQVGEFQRAIELGTLNRVELISFLSDWLVSHIQGTDNRYAQTYAEHEGKRGGKSAA